jgi:hypothetical protein
MASASVSGFAVTMNPAQTLIAGSPGEFNWGGAATTSFFIDPAEELIMIFMTQVLPSSAIPAAAASLRTMVVCAITRKQSLKSGSAAHSGAAGRRRRPKIPSNSWRNLLCEIRGFSYARKLAPTGLALPKPSLPVRLALLVAGTTLPLIISRPASLQQLQAGPQDATNACSKPCAASPRARLPRCSA